MNSLVRLILSTVAVYIIAPKIYKNVNKRGDNEGFAIVATILVIIVIIRIIFSIGSEHDDGSEIDWTIK